jgi:hypothetical protein
MNTFFRNVYLGMADYFFTAIFTFEVCLKVRAMFGIYSHRQVLTELREHTGIERTERTQEIRQNQDD